MPGKKKFLSAIKFATFRLNQAKNFIDSFNELSSFDELNEYKTTVVKCYDNVEQQLLELDVDEDDLQLIANLDQDYRPIINEINLLVKKYKPSNDSNVQESSSLLQIMSNHNNTVKLPDISLPQFEGKTTEWPRFRDLFKALIVDNNNLSNINKYIYILIRA